MKISNLSKETMGRGRDTSTKILTEEEIRAAKKLIPTMLGEPFALLSKQHGVSVEESLRFSSLAARCAQVRNQRGWSVKEVAAALKVPQYRIKAIEEGSVRSIQPDILRRYIAHLRLNRWTGRWASANSKLASKLGIRGTATNDTKAV